MLENLVTGEKSELELKCVFAAIGHVPNAAFLGDLVDTDENGYILQTQGTRTKTVGLFAAGDVADYVNRKAITAIPTLVMDGKVVVSGREPVLEEMEKIIAA